MSLQVHKCLCSMCRDSSSQPHYTALAAWMHVESKQQAAIMLLIVPDAAGAQ